MLCRPNRQKYIGIQFKKHLRIINNRGTEKLPLAEYVLETNHYFIIRKLNKQ